MKNINTEIKGDKLIVTIDLSKDFGKSKSGKSVVIASTEGNQKIGENKKGVSIVMGLTVYTKNPDAS